MASEKLLNGDNHFRPRPKQYKTSQAKTGQNKPSHRGHRAAPQPLQLFQNAATLHSFPQHKLQSALIRSNKHFCQDFHSVAAFSSSGFVLLSYQAYKMYFLLTKRFLINRLLCRMSIMNALLFTWLKQES